MPSIYFVAGEASGDNHGAALMRALHALSPDLRLLGRGGPRMKEVADSQFKDWIAEAAVVGLWEVLKHYRFFRREFHKTIREISASKPDAVVLIDYPGFNLRLARTLHESSLGGKVIYYISPQVWAWNQSRIPKMAQWLDLMLCIFPFEAELYQRSGLRTIFVGHPMVERLSLKQIQAAREPNLIGIFPGSRAREVRKLMPILSEVMRELSAARPELHFQIGAASEALAHQIRKEIAVVDDLLGKIEVLTDATSEIMQRSVVGIVASGSATLEAAFFRLPFVLIYKVAALTYLVGKMLIRVRHLGMPNVLAHREIVPEFVQGNADPKAIAREVSSLLDQPARRTQMIADFDDVITKLGTDRAGDTAARAILEAIGLNRKDRLVTTTG